MSFGYDKAFETMTFTLIDSKNENVATQLFDMKTNSFDSIATKIESGKILDVINYDIKRFVYDKCIKFTVTFLNKLQDNLIIGLYTSNDAVYYYLEKISLKTFQKYKSDSDDFYFINNEKHSRIKRDCNIKFSFKDRNFVIVKRNGDYVCLYFMGNNRIKHYENYIKFFNRYKGNSKTITIKNIFTSNNGELKASNSSTNGRSEKSVIYKDKEWLFKFLDSWINSLEYMYSLSLSHKIGILLSGNPGTGKTSLAKMIATKYNLKIVKISFDSVSKLINNDSFLNELNDSMVLIEDIDCMVTSRTGSDDSLYKENFQALLQLLDGIKTFKKTIFVATTNYEDRLDKALIRDGRFDIKIHMDDMNEIEAKEMCKNFSVSEDEILCDEKFPINPSYLQNKITKHILKNIKHEWVK